MFVLYKAVDFNICLGHRKNVFFNFLPPNNPKFVFSCWYSLTYRNSETTIFFVFIEIKNIAMKCFWLFINAYRWIIKPFLFKRHYYCWNFFKFSSKLNT